MPRKPPAPEPAPSPERQQIAVRLPAETADWLRGAAVMLRVDLAHIITESLDEHLRRLEKDYGTRFPRLPPKK